MTARRQKQERLFYIYERVQGSEVRTWLVRAEDEVAAGAMALKVLGVTPSRIELIEAAQKAAGKGK